MASPVAPEIASALAEKPEVKSSTLRKSIYVVGSIFFALAVFYIVATVRDNWAAISAHDWQSTSYSWLALAALAYGSSLVTTAMVWPAVIAKWGNRIVLRTALGIGLVAQIGKYLPGNVAHYFGRAALAKKQYDVSFTQSGLSTVVEFGAALFAAMLVALGATLLDSSIWANAPILSILPDRLFWPFVILALAAIAGVVAFIFRRSPEIRRLLSIDFWVVPIGWLIVSFLLAGFSFYALAMAFSGDLLIPVVPAIAIYAIAWAAGFLIPGAPAGLGVREVILLAFLTPIIGAAAAVILSLFHRLLSALVDLIVSGLAAFILLKKDQNHAS